MYDPFPEIDGALSRVFPENRREEFHEEWDSLIRWREGLAQEENELRRRAVRLLEKIRMRDEPSYLRDEISKAYNRLYGLEKPLEEVLILLREGRNSEAFDKIQMLIPRVQFP